VDLLSSDDYLLAADQLLGHIRRLTLDLLRRFWIATVTVAAVLAAALVTVFTVRAASPVVAAVLTAAGAIGLSWKGAAAGLGRVLAQAQRPLWESELDVPWPTRSPCCPGSGGLPVDLRHRTARPMEWTPPRSTLATPRSTNRHDLANALRLCAPRGM
jgi:hypothetical protein